MNKLISGMLLGVMLTLSVSYITTAYAKYESDSKDAASVVLYGNYSGTLVAVKVGSDGTLAVSQ
jgi:hypothetical protein